MTKTEQARVVAWRLRILQYAANGHRNVAQTCRYFGISRTAFYRWKKRYDKHGEAGIAQSKVTASTPTITALADILPALIE